MREMTIIEAMDMITDDARARIKAVNKSLIGKTTAAQREKAAQDIAQIKKNWDHNFGVILYEYYSQAPEHHSRELKKIHDRLQSAPQGEE